MVLLHLMTLFPGEIFEAQGRDSQEKKLVEKLVEKFVEKFVEIYYTGKMEILE